MHKTRTMGKVPRELVSFTKFVWKVEKWGLNVLCTSTKAYMGVALTVIELVFSWYPTILAASTIIILFSEKL